MRIGHLVVVAALLLAAIAASPASAAPRRTLDRIVALVEQDVITEHDLELALLPYLSDIYAIDDATKRMAALDRKRAEVLDQLVNEVLIVAEAEKLDLPVSDEEVDQHIAKTLKASGWSETQLLENLKQLGYPTLEAYRQKTRREMLKAYAFQIRVGSRVSVPDEELDRAYRDRYPGGTQEELRASHVLIRVPQTVTLKQVKALRDEAEAIRQRALAGEDFATLAKDHSEDRATADDGGDLGYFTRYVLDEEFTAEAFALDVGEISDVVQTTLGFHVIRATDRRQSEIDEGSKEELRSYLHEELTSRAREKAYRQWVRELRENAYIDSRLGTLSAPPAADGAAPAEDPAVPAPEPAPSDAPASPPPAADGE